MSQLPVIFAAIIGWLFCVIRRKRYSLSNGCMYFLLLVFTITGALGSNLGSIISGGALTGRRLYGLMISDTFFLIIGCIAFRSDIGRIGDFISVPILSSCCGGKLNCLLDGCCYGFVMHTNAEGVAVRFPSQCFELALWAGIMVWLITLENRGRARNTMWSLAMIWFGITRYLADLLRGSQWEKVEFAFNLPGGQFWSLVLVAMGLMFMYYSLKRVYGRNPTGREFIKAILGQLKNEELTEKK